MSNKPSLLDIVNAAAQRFDARPEHRASVEARAELHSAAKDANRVVVPVKPPEASASDEK
jgi:hypothetical protein